jgi:hypothetical protein
MNVENKNRTPVECRHCGGSTQCQKAVAFHRQTNDTRTNIFGPYEETIEHWLRCQKCGDGFVTEERRKDSDIPFDTSQLHPPMCAVCNGQGFIAI